MKNRDSRIKSRRFHSVVPLGDGSVRIQFGYPLVQPRSQLWLFAMLGNRRGNEVIVSAGKIVGVIVWPSTWLEVLKSLNAPPERVRQFKRIVRGAGSGS